MRQAFPILVTLISFYGQILLGSVAEANIWAERKKEQSVQMASLPAAFSPLTKPVSNQLSKPIWQRPSILNDSASSDSLESLLQSVSLKHGTVQQVHDAQTPNAPAIVLIQDIHMNAEAQGNIARLLDNFLTHAGITQVGVEGAFTEFDFTRFRAFPNKQVVNDVAQTFMDQKLMAAPSFVGLTTEADLPTFIGVDDKDAYKANINAYLSSLNLKDQTLKKFKDARRELNVKKEKIFSPALKKFDDQQTSFHEEKIGLGDYVSIVMPLMESLDIELNLKETLELENFKAAYDLETSLNFSRVEKERKKVLSKLTETLTETEMGTLLHESMAYQAGRLTFGDYYHGLKQLCLKHGVHLKNTPHFENYIRYILLADAIKTDRLLDALRSLETSIQNKLAETPAQKKLLIESRLLQLKEKLAHFELTPDEWAEYNQIKTETLEPFESFYTQADIRSKKMIARLLESDESERTVLVTGGFHTEDMIADLKDRNVSFIVVSPKITKLDEAEGSAYLSIFSRDKTPLEELIKGETLFVSPFQVQVTHVPLAEMTLLQTALLTTETLPIETGVTREGSLVRTDQTVASLSVQPGYETAETLPMQGFVLVQKVALVASLMALVAALISFDVDLSFLPDWANIFSSPETASVATAAAFFPGSVRGPTDKGQYVVDNFNEPVAKSMDSRSNDIDNFLYEIEHLEDDLFNQVAMKLFAHFSSIPEEMTRFRIISEIISASSPKDDGRRDWTPRVLNQATLKYMARTLLNLYETENMGLEGMRARGIGFALARLEENDNELFELGLSHLSDILKTDRINDNEEIENRLRYALGGTKDIALNSPHENRREDVLDPLINEIRKDRIDSPDFRERVQNTLLVVTRAEQNETIRQSLFEGQIDVLGSPNESDAALVTLMGEWAPHSKKTQKVKKAISFVKKAFLSEGENNKDLQTAGWRAMGKLLDNLSNETQKAELIDFIINSTGQSGISERTQIQAVMLLSERPTVLTEEDQKQRIIRSILYPLKKDDSAEDNGRADLARALADLLPTINPLSTGSNELLSDVAQTLRGRLYQEEDQRTPRHILKGLIQFAIHFPKHSSYNAVVRTLLKALTFEDFRRELSGEIKDVLLGLNDSELMREAVIRIRNLIETGDMSVRHDELLEALEALLPRIHDQELASQVILTLTRAGSNEINGAYFRPSYFLKALGRLLESQGTRADMTASLKELQEKVRFGSPKGRIQALIVMPTVLNAFHQQPTWHQKLVEFEFFGIRFFAWLSFFGWDRDPMYEEGIQTLIMALDDGTPDVESKAITALGEALPPDYYPKALKKTIKLEALNRYDSTRDDIRYGIQGLIKKLYPDHKIPSISPDFYVLTGFAADRQEDRRNREDSFGVMEIESDPDIQAASMGALARSMEKDQDYHERIVEQINALGDHLNRPALFSKLTELLDHEEPQVAANAGTLFNLLLEEGEAVDANAVVEKITPLLLPSTLGDNRDDVVVRAQTERLKLLGHVFPILPEKDERRPKLFMLASVYTNWGPQEMEEAAEPTLEHFIGEKNISFSRAATRMKELGFGTGIQAFEVALDIAESWPNEDQAHGYRLPRGVAETMQSLAETDESISEYHILRGMKALFVHSVHRLNEFEITKALNQLADKIESPDKKVRFLGFVAEHLLKTRRYEIKDGGLADVYGLLNGLIQFDQWPALENNNLIRAFLKHLANHPSDLITTHLNEVEYQVNNDAQLLDLVKRWRQALKTKVYSSDREPPEHVFKTIPTLARLASNLTDNDDLKEAIAYELLAKHTSDKTEAFNRAVSINQLIISIVDEDKRTALGLVWLDRFDRSTFTGQEENEDRSEEWTWAETGPAMVGILNAIMGITSALLIIIGTQELFDISLPFMEGVSTQMAFMLPAVFRPKPGSVRFQNLILAAQNEKTMEGFLGEVLEDLTATAAPVNLNDRLTQTNPSNMAFDQNQLVEDLSNELGRLVKAGKIDASLLPQIQSRLATALSYAFTGEAPSERSLSLDRLDQLPDTDAVVVWVESMEQVTRVLGQTPASQQKRLIFAVSGENTDLQADLESRGVPAVVRGLAEDGREMNLTDMLKEARLQYRSPEAGMQFLMMDGILPPQDFFELNAVEEQMMDRDFFVYTLESVFAVHLPWNLLDRFLASMETLKHA